LVELAKKVEYLEREKLNIEKKVMGLCFHLHIMKIRAQEEQKTLVILESDLFLQIEACNFLQNIV
jgi:hypothetical protein